MLLNQRDSIHGQRRWLVHCPPWPHVESQRSFLIFYGNIVYDGFQVLFGSEEYPIQRKYYDRIYSFGLRWTPSFAK
jgi:hypothetical protein